MKPPPGPKILPEVAKDFDGVREFLTDVFGRPHEAKLVETLRKAGKLALGLVAFDQGSLVGYVAFSPVEAGRAGRVAGLGPIAVWSGARRKGIGTLLAKKGFEALARSGHDAVVVLGEPAFYETLGFAPAGAWGLSCEYDAPAECFLAMELKPGALAGPPAVVRYVPEFASCA